MLRDEHGQEQIEKAKEKQENMAPDFLEEESESEEEHESGNEEKEAHSSGEEEESSSDELCSAEHCLVDELPPEVENINWVKCQECKEWYHAFCVKLPEVDIEAKNFKYVCCQCSRK